MSQKLPRKLVTLPSSMVMIYYRLKTSVLKTALASSNSKVIVLKRCINFCFVKKKFKKKKNIGNISTDSSRRQLPSFLQWTRINVQRLFKKYSFIFILHVYLFYMCFAQVFAHQYPSCRLQRPEGSVRSPVTEITDKCELPCWHWEPSWLLWTRTQALNPWATSPAPMTASVHSSRTRINLLMSLPAAQRLMCSNHVPER